MSVMLLVNPVMAAHGKGFPVGWHQGNPVPFMVSEGCQRDRWLTGPFVRLCFLNIPFPGIRDESLDL